MINGFIVNNKEFCRSVESFKNKFEVNDPDKVPAAIREFLLKFMEIQKSQSVSENMTKEIEENIVNLQNDKESAENQQKIHDH